MMGLFFLRKPKKQPPAPAPTTPTPIEPDPDPAPTTAYQPLALSPYLDEPPDGLPGVPDLYAILGVDPLSSDEAIRYAYRRGAARLHERKWRPGQAVRQLAELNAAYEILGNPHRRADYDRRRARWAALQASLHELGEDGRPSNGRGLPSGRRHDRRRLRLARPGGVVEVLVIVLVIALALYAAATMLSARSLVDLSWVVEIGESLGVSSRRRPANGATPTPTPQPTFAPTRQSLLILPDVPILLGAAGAEAPADRPEPVGEVTVAFGVSDPGEPVQLEASFTPG